jgi:predicted nucleic acid-binding protein
MGAQSPREVVLDTAALIGIERGDDKMSALLAASLKIPVSFLIPAGVLAQAWRGGRHQALLSRFLKTPAVEILPLTEDAARAAGRLCGFAGASDIVDASVVIAARERRCGVVTSDPADLLALDPTLKLHVI